MISNTETPIISTAASVCAQFHRYCSDCGVAHVSFFSLLHGFTHRNDAPGDAAADRSRTPPRPPQPSGTVMICAVGKPLIWKREVKGVAECWDLWRSLGETRSGG